MLTWFLGSRWGRGMGKGLSKVPGLQAKEGKVRLTARCSPRFPAILTGHLEQRNLSGCDVGQVLLQEDESGGRSEEGLMGGVGHEGTAVSIREGGMRPQAGCQP